MEDFEFKKEVEKFRRDTQEEVEKKKFNWKSFTKRAFDLWITTSVRIYNGLIKFSDSIQERQRKNDEADKKAGVKKPKGNDFEPAPFDLGESHNTPDNAPKKHTPKEKTKDPFGQTQDWGFGI